MQKPFFKSRLFKLPKHRTFDFPVRYYDEDKQRLEKKRKEIAHELGLDINDERAKRELRIREKFRSQNKGSNINIKTMWSNLRLILIFFGLLAAFYYVYINFEDLLSTITNSEANQK